LGERDWAKGLGWGGEGAMEFSEFGFDELRDCRGIKDVDPRIAITPVSSIW
jgi:hypothetical protein